MEFVHSKKKTHNNAVEEYNKTSSVTIKQKISDAF